MPPKTKTNTSVAPTFKTGQLHREALLPPLSHMILFGAVVMLGLALIYSLLRLSDASAADEIAVQTNLEQEVELLRGSRTVLRDQQLATTAARQDMLDQLNAMGAALTAEASKDANSQLAKINAVYDQMAAIDLKAQADGKLGVNLDEYNKAIQDWKNKLFARDYAGITAGIADQNTKLDAALTVLQKQQQIAQQAAPPKAAAAAKKATVSKPSGTTVNTSAGTFRYVKITAPIGTRVLTLTAATDDCTNNCPAKSLADYVTSVGGFAGMNGSYFCPPDYSFCNTQLNVFWSSVYNSSLSQWIYWDKRSWNDRAGITFSGTTPSFHATGASVPASVTAGIMNYPALLDNGNIAVDVATLDTKQKSKGTRGAFGFNGSTLFLVTMYNASVTDEAYIMQALGATNAINLDGGGSSAMYQNGHYIVGPGRLLPNAIVFAN